MSKFIKDKIELTIAQIATLCCAIGVIKSKDKAVKTMFGFGAVGTTVWSILKGIRLENEDDTYRRTNVEGDINDTDNIENLIERFKNERTAKSVENWTGFEKARTFFDTMCSKNVKAKSTETVATTDNDKQTTEDKAVVPESTSNKQEPKMFNVFESGMSDSNMTGYMHVTAPFMQGTVEDMQVVESTESFTHKSVSEVIDSADTDSQKVANVVDFDLLGNIEEGRVNWSVLDEVGKPDNIVAFDYAIFEKLLIEFGYSFIKEQGPSKMSWSYETNDGYKERFIAVSVDLNKMMDAYREGIIRNSVVDSYRECYIVSTSTSKHIRLTDLVADTVYISDVGTVLVLLGKSNSKAIHTVASKHCKHIGLITLAELNKATCNCLWS